ncbi:MAG: hypothetical protein IT165_31945 [Bryobacterales bacterium]|nr:hypothetical protein [Bryobacterales bacterium]
MSSNNSAIGMDVGTSRVVLAQKPGKEFTFKTQLNAFVRIPYSKITENVLKKEQVPYSVDSGELVVHGNESERFADLLGRETRRPMRAGLLNPGEPESEAQMQQIFRSLLGSDSGDGKRLFFSVPAPPLGTPDNTTYHEATIRGMLTEMGYQVQPVSEGLAVVYGELEDSNYTGIGISCGGGLCNVCLAYLSVPVLNFSIPKAGDFIDNSAAQAAGELATRIRIVKESGFHFNGHYSDKVQQVIGVYYEDMIQSLVNGIKEAFAAAKSVPKMGRPVPLVLSGGSVMPKGFQERFERVLKANDFPVPVSEIRLAKEPLHSTARGTLFAALSEA